MVARMPEEARPQPEAPLLRRLKRQLTGYYLVVLLAMLALYALGAYALMRYTMIHSLDHLNARMVAPVLTELAHHPNSYEELLHELSELAVGEDEHLALLAHNGRVLYARGMTLDPEPELQAGIVTVDAPEPMRLLIVPLEGSGHTFGYLRVGQSLNGPERTLASLLLGLLVMAPLAVWLAWLGGTWLARRAMRPVAAAFERERQFTRDASHELRTPLALVLSHAQLAKAAPALSPEAREKLEVIERSARRMALLVGDLLTLGRSDAGIHDAAMSFSLEELVDEEVEALAIMAEERGLSLDFVSRAARPTIRGEPARLAQAVRNLLENALRYTEPPAVIQVMLSERGDRLALTVSNPGPEIPGVEKERIFERFVRLEAARVRNPEGSGLGLAIARAVAQAHGGELMLTSRPDGNTFTLLLPRA